MSLQAFTHRWVCFMGLVLLSGLAACAVMPATVYRARDLPIPPSFIYTPPPQPEPPAHLFDGVVAVYTGPNNSMGSGFVVHIDSLRVWIMTAYHVIDENIGRASLPTIQGQVATIHAVSPRHDLALLQIGNDGRYEHVLSFAGTQIGDEVRAVGYSRWMGREVRLAHYGHVVSTSFVNWNGQWQVTHNAGVRGGLSGGPLLNRDGKVVGIASFFADKGIGWNDANSSEVCSIPGVSAELFLNRVLPGIAGPPQERITN